MKTYFTQYLNTKPYKINIDKDNRKIFVFKKVNEHEYTEQVFECEYSKVFLVETDKKEQKGLAVLVNLKDSEDNKYAYIGDKVYTFETNEKLLELKVKIIDDKVYVWANSKRNSYLFIPKVIIGKVEDPWTYMGGLDRKEIKDLPSFFHYKLIHEVVKEKKTKKEKKEMTS